MALHSFCGILTLQVGVALIAVVFWTLSTLIFVVNFFDFFTTKESDTHIFAMTITIFVTLLLVAGLIEFFSAYNESNSLCMAGVGLISLITIMWVIVSSLSFYNDNNFLQYVCVNDRCPETFWLAPLKYRLDTTINPEKINETGLLTPPPTTPTPSTSEQPDWRKRSVTANLSVIDTIEHHNNIFLSKKNFHASYPELFGIKYVHDTEEEIPTTTVVGSGYQFGLPLVGAVVLFICNFFLFLFSILVLWSYGQELAWTNSYLSDIPDYVTS